VVVALAPFALFGAIGCRGGQRPTPPETAAENPPADEDVETANGPDDSVPPDEGPSAADPTDPGPQEPATQPMAGCSEYAGPTPRGNLPAVINEASGLVASRQHAGTFWLHNDSGDAARVFGIDAEGELLTTCSLEGVYAIDWEDLALGPCGQAAEPSGEGPGAFDCLYLGDTGDNDQLRSQVQIYRVTEPDPSDGDQTIPESEIEVMSLVYPEGARDSEALVVDAEGVVYLLSKESGSFELFSAPFTDGSRETLESLGRFGLAGAGFGYTVTAADFSPVAGRLLVRTYRDAIEYRLPADGTLGTLEDRSWRSVPLALELQGESIAYAPAAEGYWHVSEGQRPPLYYVGCRDE
jgi:hypothetical protein